MVNVVPLSTSLKVNQGSHILYFYNTIEGYIENAVSYIVTGINLGYHVIFIDSKERYKMVMDKLGNFDTSKVHYVDNHEFYELYQDFHFDRILNNLKHIIQPFVENETTVRLWGHVDWIHQDNIINKLHTYECNSDITIAELGFTTVCAYNGETVPAKILTEMMKTHEYLMTDDELVRSNLYKTSNQYNPTIFPSLSAQKTIDSEMDWYRQKLDFVHVVSHEVRNPLTVIKAYASLLAEDEEHEGRRKRLEAIKSFAVVIDNEISHIINTEQMLSTDAFWQRKLIRVLPAMTEVIEIMRIKAQTQNIILNSDFGISGKELILSNTMGFKMIISNLISNAIKYSFEGNVVDLRVNKENQALVIEVKDHGIGMTEVQLQNLYQKYEKINQDESGQGIGLFMVKKLVDHFDGEIEVQSQLNKGSIFRVRLPIQT
jgi:two-component sensor histidine kinase